MVKNMNEQKKPYNKPGIVFENFQTGELTGTPEMIEKIKKAVEKNTEDIFERLKKALDCTYISDMRTEPYCSKAKALLKEMDIDDYSLNELNEIAFYLYGMQFANREQALGFLKS